MNADRLFPLIVAQTVQVTLLAGIVLGLTKLLAKDRPHLAHALWALVLLKCLTPPLFASPMSVFSWLPKGYAVIAYQSHQPSPENAALSDSVQQFEGSASVLEPVSQEANTGARVAPFSDSFASTATSKVRGISLVSIAIYVWITIAACVFTVNVLRLWIFLRRVKKATLPTPLKLSRLVERVSKRIGLRRKIQIRTVDAAIGPAVVGLIWPTILLPKAIVDGKSDVELEPLLAHELIHVRRGDLVWAMLQGLSVSLWWFNPLVWLAERLLTREAERSCDEETIAGLGCSPAVYARSLLDVMERRHQLRAAPSLPGVRPVDITAKRLERIMRLGQGSYRQRPWWVVVVWLIGCAIVLPGAAWVAAQEKPKQENGVFNEAKFIFDELVTPALPFATEKLAKAMSGYELRSFPVESAVKRHCKEMGLKKADSENELIRLLLKNMDWKNNESKPKYSIVVNSEGPAFNISMGGSEPPVKIVGEVLYACATSKELNQIENSLDHFRKFGFGTFTTDIELYEIPRALKLEDQSSTAADAELDKFVSNLPGRFDDKNNSVVVLDVGKLATLKQLLNQEDNSRVNRPQTVAYAGQPATVQVGIEQAYTVGYSEIKAENGQVDFQPVVQKFHAGFRIETVAIAREDSRVYREIKFLRSEIERCISQSKKFPGSDREFSVEIPSIRSTSFETGVELKSDQTLVLIQRLQKKTVLVLLKGQQNGGPLPNVRASNAVQTALPEMGRRVAVPTLGPAPVAFDFVYPQKNADGDQTQTFSFFMGFTR